MSNKNSNKVLVRNASLPIRSCKITGKSNNVKKVHFSDDVSQEGGNQIFTVPEFCTLLQLTDEMKAVRNTQCSSRSLPEVPKYRNLNFSPAEKLYQGLIGIDVPEEELVSEVRSQPCVKIKKDPELEFSNYIKQDLQPEYFFTSCAIPTLRKKKTVYSGYLLYSERGTWRKFLD